MISDLLYRLRALFRRDNVEGELIEELRFHLENQVQVLMKAGLTREEAIRKARISFGTAGRPGWPLRTFPVQNNPTVAVRSAGPIAALVVVELRLGLVLAPPQGPGEDQRML